MDYEAILLRKLRGMFPDADQRAEVMGVLNDYGAEAPGREVVRIRLAILRIAGDNPQRIREMTRLARQDYRDVLMSAEYPRQARAGVMPDGPDKAALAAADRAEYLAWLDT